MFNWFHSGGIFMWLILVFFIAAVFIATRVYGNIKKKSVGKATLDLKTLLVLGVSSMALGVIGQLLGIYAALGAIIVATDISPAIVLEGFRIASVSTVFGTVLFLVTMLIWFGLREYLFRTTE
ncbi:MAG: hypothetical protein H8E26_13230 [FCB group bacterium]|nr:hypothetical protein [FCB group bacterium]MBL7028547.1 hypothetical protein [Candidatus Neomarinimicrobiota bacterium]MBL7120766.1 hypothetical protein [Candidatus Neomarinimicrobiota bacterium]